MLKKMLLVLLAMSILGGVAYAASRCPQCGASAHYTGHIERDGYGIYREYECTRGHVFYE